MLSGRPDRPRLDHLAAKAAEQRAEATDASDPKRRADHIKAARTFERSLRLERAFPIQVWRWGASGVVVLLPWAFLAHSHHVVLGLVGSGIVLLAIAIVRFRVRRSRR
jgi:hypothetical protein